MKGYGSKIASKGELNSFAKKIKSKTGAWSKKVLKAEHPKKLKY